MNSTPIQSQQLTSPSQGSEYFKNAFGLELIESLWNGDITKKETGVIGNNIRIHKAILHSYLIRSILGFKN